MQTVNLEVEDGRREVNKRMWFESLKVGGLSEDLGVDEG